LPRSITVSTAANTAPASLRGEGVDDVVEQRVGGDAEQPGRRPRG
jgi:hypothetical protein